MEIRVIASRINGKKKKKKNAVSVFSHVQIIAGDVVISGENKWNFPKLLHKHFSMISLLFKVVITRSYFWFHLQRPPFFPASVLHYSGTIRVWEQTTSSTTMADEETC